MKLFKTNYLLYSAIASSLFLASCNSDDDSNGGNNNNGTYSRGIFVLNEGNMGKDNSEISFINAANELTLDVFSLVNGSGVGDTAQSMLEHNDKYYIVLNASNTIEVVNSSDFKKVGTIAENLSNPRYIEEENGTLYVTNWGNGGDEEDDFVAMFDATTLAYKGKIAVKFGPEKIIESNDKLYVAHKGGWTSNNIVSVIDTRTNTVIKEISVGDSPDGLIEENNTLYVLCSGYAWGNPATYGSLVKINTTTNEVTSTLTFANGENPSCLEEENNQLYYVLNGGVYELGLNATTLPTQAKFSPTATSIYGFKVEDNNIYVTDAKDFNSAGSLFVYGLNGQLQNTFTVGINPGFIYIAD